MNDTRRMELKTEVSGNCERFYLSVFAAHVYDL